MESHCHSRAITSDGWLKKNLSSTPAREPASQPVELYVAWYDSQRAGRSAHSPRTCLPGGGWQIVEFEQVDA